MSRIPGVNVPVDPRDLAPAERLARFRRELAETRREDQPKLLEKYLDPDAPIRLGVTVGEPGKRPVQVNFRRSLTANAPASAAPGKLVTVHGRGEHIRRVNVRAPDSLFKRPPPPKRAPLARAESMTKRLVAEWRKGNTAVLETLLREICTDYWRAGMPITEQAIRVLATKLLQQSEAKLKAADHKRGTRRWAG